MTKEITVFRVFLAIAAGILALFFAVNLFSQVQKKGDFWKEERETRQPHRKNSPYWERSLTKFGHPDDRAFEAIGPSVSKDFSGDIAWAQLELEGGMVTNMALHPSNSEIAYASFYSWGDRAPIYKTTNGGANWERIAVLGRSIYSLAIDPTDPNTIYAGTYRYLYKSTDGGISWHDSVQIGYNYIFIQSLVVNKNNGNILYGGGYFLDYPYEVQPVFFKTTDGGINWSVHGFDNSPSGYYYYDDMAVDTAYNNVFFTYDYYDPLHYDYVPLLYKSTDGGTTWLPTNYANSISDCMWISSIAFNPLNPNTVYAGTVMGLYKSTDGGTNWTLFPALSGSSIYSVLVDPTDSCHMFCGGYTEIYRSTDCGINWDFLGESERLYGEFFEYLLIGHSSPTVIYTGNYSGVFKSTDQGDNWNPINNEIYSALIVQIAINPNVLYVWADGDACYRSTDGGYSFERRGHPSGCSYCNDFVADPLNPLVLFVGGG